MAFNEKLQSGGFDNQATQEKLETWWGMLSAKDREKILSSVKEPTKLKTRQWSEIVPATQAKLFQAGSIMVKLTKDFPR
jgi:hypothetical protein